MSRYTLHEPFPQYSHVSSMSFGRGGAGNRTGSTVPSKARTQLPPSSITTSQAHPGPKYSSGRGGAGNMHRTSEDRAIFHFDEELERDKLRNQNVAPVYHVGRGGEGNVIDKRRASQGSEGSHSSAGKKGLDWVKGLARK